MENNQINYLRKIIKEQIQNIVANENLVLNSDLNVKIKNDLEYLKDFKFEKFIKKDSRNIWKFNFLSSSKEYIINCYITEENGTWKAKTYIYWKKESSDFSPNAGKDAEQDYGKYSSYDIFVKNCNLKLKNNLLVGTGNYHDDFNLGMDKESVMLLKKIIEYGPKLEKVNSNNNFNDLIKIYHEVKNLSDQEILKYAQDKTPDEGSKQTFILNLQNVNKYNFYVGMDKMHGNK